MAFKEDDDQSKEEKKDSSDENFGLPDLEMKPLDEPKSGSAEPASGGSPGSYDSTYGSEEPKSNAPVVLTIVIILVVAIAGYLIYQYVYVPRAAESAKKEQAARDAAAKRKADAEQKAKEQAAFEAEQRRLAELAKTPPVGTIDILSARTKRYYVIICSDIDDDLLMDYAKKLTATGVSLKVIPPFGGKQFHRLAIADHDTFALAQTNADATKATYGNGVWVLKY